MLGFGFGVLTLCEFGGLVVGFVWMFVGCGWWFGFFGVF